MSGLQKAWDLIRELTEHSVLQALSLDEEDVESIRLFYDGRQEQAPCIVVLTVLDRIAYVLCITKILDEDQTAEPKCILCKVNFAGEKIPAFKIRDRTDIMPILPSILPYNVAKLLRDALDFQTSPQT